jgi:hypothetical protein
LWVIGVIKGTGMVVVVVEEDDSEIAAEVME